MYESEEAAQVTAEMNSNHEEEDSTEAQNTLQQRSSEGQGDNRQVFASVSQTGSRPSKNCMRTAIQT